VEFKLVERPEGHLEYEPRPTPDALAAYYRDKYFGADHGQTPYAHGYTAEELEHKRLQPAETEHIWGRPPGRMLEVGVGEGFSLDYFASRGWEVVGMDFTDDGLQAFFPGLADKLLLGDAFELLDQAIARGLAYAPYADIVWCETSHPDLDQARRFAEAIHAKFPGKMLAYNCSPSFNWKLNLDEETIANFQKELGEMGYAFQFVTLAGFHNLNAGMFELALGYRDEGMAAYARFQQKEFEMQKEHGFRAIKHQSFVGAGYFDEVQMVISHGESSTVALKGSTEEEQFTAGKGNGNGKAAPAHV